MRNMNESQFDELFDVFHEHFTVNRKTRTLYWKRPTTSRVKPGDKAGHTKPNGLALVGFYSEVYKTKRVVEFMITGVWPTTGSERQKEEPENVVAITKRNA